MAAVAPTGPCRPSLGVRPDAAEDARAPRGPDAVAAPPAHDRPGFRRRRGRDPGSDSAGRGPTRADPRGPRFARDPRGVARGDGRRARPRPGGAPGSALRLRLQRVPPPASGPDPRPPAPPATGRRGRGGAARPPRGRSGLAEASFSPLKQAVIAVAGGHGGGGAACTLPVRWRPRQALPLRLRRLPPPLARTRTPPPTACARRRARCRT